MLARKTILVVALLASPISTALAIDSYIYTDLGASFYAGDINNAGQVVGGSSRGSGSHVLLYSGGELQDLGIPPGCTRGFACGINNAGQIVGYCYDSFCHGFLYRDRKSVV
jgi:probable HAF family extracellular repeat protein